jgi:PAS domain S-box-containing protein
LNLISDGVCLLDQSGRELYSNESYQLIRQQNNNEFQIETDPWPWIKSKSFETIRQEILEDGSHPENEPLYLCQLKDYNGDSQEHAVVIRPHHNASGNLTCFLGLISLETTEALIDDRFDIIEDYFLDSKNVNMEIETTLFSTLVKKSLSGILIVNMHEIRFANEAFEKITGYSQQDLRNMSPWDMVHPEEREKIRNLGLARFKNSSVRESYETRWVHKKGHELWVEVRATLIDHSEPPEILANIIDITDRKRAEADLEVKSRRLEETNTALKILLQQQNEQKEELQKNIVFNVDQLIMPYIDELESFLVKPRNKAFVQAIKENLKEIIAPFTRTLSTKYANLTPKQLTVINLIRHGKTTKEIAETLCVSKAAVDFHRHNIRQKLNLTKKKVNLRSFLDLMEQQKKQP